MNLVEKDVDEVIFNFKLREFCRIVNSVFTASSTGIGFLDEVLNFLIQNIRDAPHLGLLIGAHGRKAAITTLNGIANLTRRGRLVAQVLGHAAHVPFRARV